MAQKITDIYNQIVAAKEAESALANLDTQASDTMAYFIAQLSTSRVSIWRLWAYVVAFYLWMHEKQNDIYQSELELWAKTRQQTTLKWYQSQTLAYLFGKPLIWDELLGKFIQVLDITDDENALKVVKYCAVTKSPNKLRVKVAGDGGGLPTTLPPAQAIGIAAYLNQIAAAGDTIEIVNNPADKLNVNMDVYVNPLVIDLATGQLHNSSEKPAEDAARSYLLGLDFDGRFYRNAIIDALQKAHGVTDIDLNVLQWKYGSFPYTDVDVSIVPDAGYFEIETLTINYLAAE